MKNNILLSLLAVLFLIGFGGCSGEGDGEDDFFHNQGKSCLSCHRSSGTIVDDQSGADNDEPLITGATVYTKIDAADTENLASGYRIRLTLQYTGEIVRYEEGRGVGNSAVESDEDEYSVDMINYYTAQVVDSGGNIVNSSLSNSHGVARLDCNYCHTAAGKVGAPGRITSYDYYNTPVDDNITVDDNVTVDVNLSAISFASDVMPVLESKCKFCHISGGLGGVFVISDVSSTHGYITTNLVDANVSSSLLLTKGMGLSHLGGTVVQTTSTEYQILENWITQGTLNN